jgi:hypothetical protein
MASRTKFLTVPGHRADLVGQGRQAQRHALAGEALGLAVQWLVLAILLEQQHGGS